MEQDTLAKETIFNPTKSRGGVYFLLLFITIEIILGTIQGIIWIFTPSIAFFGFFVGISLLLGISVWSFYGMKYILGEKDLILKSGLYKTTISYDSISAISKPTNSKYKGLRIFGVALPGYYAGRFKLFLDGKFESVRLFATKLDNLIFIHGKNIKGKEQIYGLTPEDHAGFVNMIKTKQSSIRENQIDPRKPLVQDALLSKKCERLTTISYFIALTIPLVSALILLLIYPFLPEIIPLHYNIYGTPDSWGHKSTYLIMFAVINAIEIVLTLLIYHLGLKKSDLSKTNYGYVIMSFITCVCIVFFIIMLLSMVSIISTS